MPAFINDFHARFFGNFENIVRAEFGDDFSTKIFTVHFPKSAFPSILRAVRIAVFQL
jgi:hypothetical protein